MDRSKWLLLGIALIGIAALQSYHFINQDVAFLVWAADQITGPPVYGHDILEINPPLCLLIYMPAVGLAQFVGFDAGIRIWMFVLTAASILTLWQTADRPLRLQVAVILLVFVLLAYPNHFAQREQIVLLLCAPYVTGPARSRGWGLLSGIMAGIGFLMKPYFLIPLALVFVLRRRLRIEEYAILATGAVYGLILITFFQAYLFEMVPMVSATYWAIDYPVLLTRQVVAVFGLAGIVLLFAAPQPEARPYLAAAIGFGAAAYVQQKGFYYHFIPAAAFLGMYTVISLRNDRKIAIWIAALSLAIQCFLQIGLALAWLQLKTAQQPFAQALDAEIDGSRSYANLALSGTGPQLIHTQSRYVGLAGFQMFMPAVIADLKRSSPADQSRAAKLALDQAIRELRNNPDMVIVSAQNHNGEDFDVLGWLLQDPVFRALWNDYRPTRSLGDVMIYRRS